MRTLEFVHDSLDRVHELIPAVLDGLGRGDLLWRPDAEANPLGWLIWHLLRVEDDHLAQLADSEQVWLTEGWQQDYSLPYPKAATGYGMTPAEVGLFSVPDTDPLVGYAGAVWQRSRQILDGLDADDLDRVVDTRYTPPVTMAVRLVSVVVETAQHVGQAAYVRGLRERSLGMSSGWAGTPR